MCFSFDPLKDLLGYGHYSDLYLEQSSALGLRWENGQIEALTRSNDSGAGLRTLNNLETRFGYADLPNPFESISSDSLSKLKKIQKQFSFGLPHTMVKAVTIQPQKQHSLQINPTHVSLDQKSDLLKKAFNATQIDPAIRQTILNYGEKQKTVACLNSEGRAVQEQRTYVVFSIQVTAEKEGDRQNAYDAIGGVLGFELFSRHSIEAMARSVALRALEKLKAPQAPTGEMPVVISASAGGTLIHEAVGHALEADAVLEGTSPAYSGKVGKVVANSKLTVYDDPTVPGKRGSFHYDDEGVPSQASRLIENGVLKDYMFDQLSARRAGRASNGHGRRESYAHRPIPRMSNTFIAPGPDDPDKILKNFKNGLLVTRMGGGQVNTANGDFVFEVEEGFHVENGKKKMVRGATLLGNGPDVLHSIDQVGSDQGWGIGTCGKEGQGVPVSDAIPTVHIKKLVIGGQ